MSSPASIARHPIHPMLVSFPIGLWVFSLVADIVFHSGGAPVWEPIAFWTMVGGTIGALLAAVPGLVDLLSIRGGRAWRIGLAHMGLNLVIVAMYATNLWLRTRPTPGSFAPVWLSAIAVGMLLVSGWLGGELVYVLGMGVEAPPAPARETEIRTERRDVSRSA